jgi:hypothetical protein
VGIKDENYKGQYDLFLNTTLRLQDNATASPLSLTAVKEAIIAALVELRFEHPECACSAIWDEQGPILQYTPPEGTDEANSWAESTIELWFTAHTGLAVRKEIGKRRKEVGSIYAGHAKSLAVHLVVDVPDSGTQLSGKTVDFLLHMNHMYWDGISARMFLGSLIQRIGTKLGEEQGVGHLNWRQEVENLSKPILDASRIDITSLGADFENARTEFIESLTAFAVSAL